MTSTRPSPRHTPARVVMGLLGALALVGLAFAGCGKGPNLHPVPLHDFPSALPELPRPLTANIAPAWTSGRAIAVDGARVVVVDRDNGDLVTLDAANLAVTGRVAVGARPEQVVVGPDGAALVTVRRAGELVRVSPDLRVTHRVPVGTEPFGVALSPDGMTAFVTLSRDHQLVVLDALTLEEIDRVDTRDTPRGLAVSPNGWVLVIHEHADPLSFYLGAADDIAGLGGERPLRRANPTDLMSGQRRGLIPTRALAAAIRPEDGGALVAHVLAAPGSPDELLNAIVMGEVEGGGSADGGYGSVSASAGVSFEAPVRPIEVAVTGFGPGGELVGEQPSLPVQDPHTGEPIHHLIEQPSDIVHHPTWTLAFVTGYGSDTVLALNTAGPDPMRSPLALIAVGAAPRAIAIAADGETAFVLNDHALTVSRVDLRPLFALPEVSPSETHTLAGGSASSPPHPGPHPDARFAASTAGPFTRATWLREERVAAFGVDPLPPAVRRGARVFTFARNGRMSHAGQFACASCHFEGTEDKLVWFITDGPRQTPSLAGRLADTAPYNWGGTKDDLISNMEQTVSRMGGDGLSQSELEDLEQFMLHGLEPPVNPHLAPSGELTAQQAWGKTLFEDPVTKCASCHRGVELTDGFNHDVGTASAVELHAWELRQHLDPDPGERPGRLNTPTLRGLYYTAPYLHDGSAETLYEVLERTGDTMGKSSHLTREEREALVAYLLTL